jgi:hypothetical protein
MSAASTEKFARFHYRPQPDGTIDSICALCFLTVATANSFDQLHQQEVNHSCIPLAHTPAP